MLPIPFQRAMFRVLAGWISVAVVACPLLCEAGIATAGSEAGCGCCAHRDAAADPSQAPAEPESGGDCQCICGGAVFEEGLHLDHFGVATEWVVLHQADLPQVTLHRGDLAPAIEPPVGSMNVGRALCCRFASFLC